MIKTPKKKLEKDSIMRKIQTVRKNSSEPQLKIEPSEPLTEPIIKKNLKKTRYVHIPSVALGAGIAISCLVLGIFLANFIDMEDSQLLAEIPTITNIEKQQNAQILVQMFLPKMDPQY